MFTMRRVLMVLVAMMWTHSSFAQINNVENLIRGGLHDTNLLLESYLKPFGKGFGANLNNGWFNTGRTHKFLGFDIMVTGNAAIAPVSDKTFDVSGLDLQNLRLVNPGVDTNSPTVVGDEESGPALELVLPNPQTGQDEVIGPIVLPQGSGFRAVPSPMIQASLGIFSNTDVILRFFPETEIDDEVGNIKLFGVGVKHDVNQWFGGDLLPLDLSIMAGYTVFQASSGHLNLQPDLNAVPTGASYDNQKVEIEAKSFTANLIASKQFAILTLFGGVGIESSTVDLKLKGTYPVTVIEDDPASANFGQRVILDLSDPTDLSFDGANSRRAFVGLRLNLLIVAIHGSYTFSDYPVATVGVGLSIR
ncbi:MAG: DUF6588 family protein [bacterium]